MGFSGKTFTEPRMVQGDLGELPPTPLLRPFGGGQGGFQPDNVNQGKIEDCCLAAVLAAMANTRSGRERIKTMINFEQQQPARSMVDGKTVVTSGVVSVRFGLAGTEVEISRLLYREAGVAGEAGDILYAHCLAGEGWVSFIEKAYAVLVSRRKQMGPSYASLIQIEPQTAMQDLLAPRQAPLAIPVSGRSAPGVIRRWLARAKDVPTVATTPKGANDAFETPTARVMANHAYAVCGLRAGKEKDVKKSVVRLSSDQDEIELGQFIKDFDFIITLRD